MKKEVVILIAEDDEAHVLLIQSNLKRAGISNEQLVFPNGREVLDFLLRRGTGRRREPDTSYLLLLDIRMPKVDGTEVLRQVKADPALKRMPVIVVTTTDDPREIAHCHELGCSSYVTKPLGYDQFVEAIRRLGLFLLVVEVPKLNHEE
ncbi:response regulator [candidate division WOR-3 bacterium]|uniref:Response regulator n=1 Tax=candidate division WOR-3 bacterium TaxID=2052148 RepID=A0A937XGY1_UNCW3|nr:response regulator [candidate division WOR-3 bacterium]